MFPPSDLLSLSYLIQSQIAQRESQNESLKVYDKCLGSVEIRVSKCVANSWGLASPMCLDVVLKAVEK